MNLASQALNEVYVWDNQSMRTFPYFQVAKMLCYSQQRSLCAFTLTNLVAIEYLHYSHSQQILLTIAFTNIRIPAVHKSRIRCSLPVHKTLPERAMQYEKNVHEWTSTQAFARGGLYSSKAVLTGASGGRKIKKSICRHQGHFQYKNE